MLRLKKWMLIYLCCLIPSLGYSKDRLTNYFLREQIENSELRVLPSNEYFVGGVDGHLFFRPGEPSYYHGGYWVDNFLEISPNNHLRFNLRMTFLNPAASYGVASDSDIHHFFGVSWKDNLKNMGLFLDAELEAIFFDLDRQTLGVGLTLQDKEMSGLLMDVMKGETRFRFILDGTGGYNVDGDILYAQVDWKENLVGLSGYIFDGDKKGFVSLYSTYTYANNIGHLLEVSERGGAVAYLLGMTHDFKSKWFESYLKIQGRGYGDSFAADIKGQVEHDYLSVEQEDKDFTDSMNIFVMDDDVIVAAIRWDFRWFWTQKFGLVSNNEYSIWDFERLDKEEHYFYKAGLFLCPRAHKKECAELFYANKMTTALNNPKSNDRRNIFSFEEEEYFGFAARFSF
jgi:hypothetical protein